MATGGRFVKNFGFLLLILAMPVVTGGAELQEGGGIARAWIEDPNAYPVIPMPNDGAGCLRGQWWLQAAVWLKLWVFCV